MSFQLAQVAVPFDVAWLPNFYINLKTTRDHNPTVALYVVQLPDRCLVMPSNHLDYAFIVQVKLYDLTVQRREAERERCAHLNAVGDLGTVKRDLLITLGFELLSELLLLELIFVGCQPGFMFFKAPDLRPRLLAFNREPESKRAHRPDKQVNKAITADSSIDGCRTRRSNLVIRRVKLLRSDP